MKRRLVADAGTYRLIKRLYDEGGRDQWLREALQNALDAGATRVEFSSFDAPKRRKWFGIVDNGHGITAVVLNATLSKMFDTTRDFELNFGMGLRIATVPTNEHGVYFVSRTPQDGLIACRIYVDAYQMWWERVDPPRGWLPSWVGESGTAVILSGMEGETTVPPKQSQERMARWLSERYLTFGGATVKFEKLSRSVLGIGDRWDDRFRRDGIAGGVIELADGTELFWRFHSPNPDGRPGYQFGKGAVALTDGKEIYELRGRGNPTFAQFADTASIQGRLVLVLQPPLRSDGHLDGWFPSNARDGLRRQGTTSIPWHDWAREWQENMPPEIAAEMAEQRVDEFLNELVRAWEELDRESLDFFDERRAFRSKKMGELEIAEPDLPGRSPEHETDKPIQDPTDQGEWKPNKLSPEVEADSGRAGEEGVAPQPIPVEIVDESDFPVFEERNGKRVVREGIFLVGTFEEPVRLVLNRDYGMWQRHRSFQRKRHPSTDPAIIDQAVGAAFMRRAIDAWYGLCRQVRDAANDGAPYSPDEIDAKVRNLTTAFNDSGAFSSVIEKFVRERGKARR